MAHNDTNEIHIFTSDAQTDYVNVNVITQSQFTLLATGISRGAQTMEGWEAGTQTEFRKIISFSNYEDNAKVSPGLLS